MLQGLKNVTLVLKALNILCEAALGHAEAEGLSEVGAEHFLLASFELPDGTASRAFAAVGLDQEGLRAAIEQHYARSLEEAGVRVRMPPSIPITKSPSPWVGLPASASGKAVLDRLSEHYLPGDALCGAQVILAALAARHGVVPRVLKLCGIERQALAASAKAERDAYHSSR